MKVPRPAMNEAGDKRAASAVSIVPRLYCGSCETDVKPSLTWNGPHIEARCGVCQGHIRHVKQVEPWVSLVPPKIIQLSMFESVA